MNEDTARRPPEPVSETTARIEGPLLAQIVDALVTRHGLDEAELDGRSGDASAWLRMRIGPEQETWELELFVRDLPGEALDGAVGVLVDYLDGFLDAWVNNEREGWAPLDWEGRPFTLADDKTYIVFVRGEVRNLEAEDARDHLLKGSNERS